MSKKRFTDCDMWESPWFMGLSTIHKLFWRYLCDRCDNAGVWVPNARLVMIHIGDQVDLASAQSALSAEVRLLPNNRWQLIRFLEFQYGLPLSPKSAPHRAVIRILTSHGLDSAGRWLEGLDRLPSSLKEEETEKEKDRGSAEGEPTARIADFAASLTAPSQTPVANLSDDDRWPFIAKEDWAQQLAVIVGNKLSRRNWAAWARLIKITSLARVIAAAESLDPDNRWPDQVETVLRNATRGGSQPPKPPAPHTIAWSIVDQLGWQDVSRFLKHPEWATSDQALRDLIYDAPECCQEVIAGHKAANP